MKNKELLEAVVREKNKEALEARQEALAAEGQLFLLAVQEAMNEHPDITEVNIETESVYDDEGGYNLWTAVGLRSDTADYEEEEFGLDEFDSEAVRLAVTGSEEWEGSLTREQVAQKVG